jgi:hypothetical protein
MHTFLLASANICTQLSITFLYIFLDLMVYKHLCKINNTISKEQQTWIHWNGHVKCVLISLYKLKLSHYMPQRRWGKRRYSSYLFLASAVDGGEWPASCPGCALAPEQVWIQATGKILSPLPEMKPQSPGRPACIQTLYWLSYPAHSLVCTFANYLMQIHFSVLQYCSFSIFPKSYISGIQWKILPRKWLSQYSVYGMDDQGLISSRGKGFFFQPLHLARPALRPTQLPLQWVWGGPFPGE